MFVQTRSDYSNLYSKPPSNNKNYDAVLRTAKEAANKLGRIYVYTENLDSSKGNAKTSWKSLDQTEFRNSFRVNKQATISKLLYGSGLFSSELFKYIWF